MILALLAIIILKAFLLKNVLKGIDLLNSIYVDVIWSTWSAGAVEYTDCISAES